jgi:hypothetical protein
MKELTTTKAYVSTKLTCQDVITKHIDDNNTFHINISKHDVPTMYWLPKLHKKPYKSRFIANSSNCTTTSISKHLTSALTTIKGHVVKYCNSVFTNSGVNYFWSIKNSGAILDKLHLLNYKVKEISTFDFSTLYTTLPHDLIKDKLQTLIRWAFDREGKTYLATNTRTGFFSSNNYKSYKMWTCLELCKALCFLLDNIFVRFGDKIYRQVVGIPMGTNCAPLVADLFLYCYERDFMIKLQKANKTDLINSFNRTSRYLDDILNLDNPAFSKYIKFIYPKELSLIKANQNDNCSPFLDLDINIINGTAHTKIYDKRDDFGFQIVNYPWLDGDIPRLPSYGIYISQLLRYARACSDVNDFHSRNIDLTTKLISQGYRYHKLRKTFGKFYRRYPEILLRYGQVSISQYVTRGISQPSFYGDLVYKLRRIKNNPDVSSVATKILRKFLKRSYDPLIVRRTTCLVLGPFTASYWHRLWHCTPSNNTTGTQ